MTSADRIDVFVSYRHRDPTMTWVRAELVPALQAADLTVLLDVNDFIAGRTLMEEIEGSSERARVTLAVVDEHYDQSGFTAFEAAVGSTLLVVQRPGAGQLPSAEHTVDLRATEDPSSVVAKVHELVKRVFVLESEDQEGWVTGFLLPALWRADVEARHIGDLTAGQNEDEAIDAAIERADQVVVVVSAAYLQQVHGRAGARLAQWEAEHNVDKSIPVVFREGEQPLVLPPRFRHKLAIDVGDRALWDDALRRICEALDVSPPRLDEAPECPYPGMRPYREDGHYPFVGRDREITAVLEQLDRRRVATVIGPSGSGKSSLVLAGVLPRIRQRGLLGRPNTKVEVVRPTDPLEAALDRLGPHDPSTTRVLVVDQLEQALPQATTSASADVDAAYADANGGSDDDPGRRFLQAILDRRQVDDDLHLIVTVRADFYAQLMSSPIWTLLELDLVPVTPLAGESLRDAIRLPARSAGAVIHEPLVVDLANETEGQPGLMPFLQETLRRLWGRQPWWYLSLTADERASGEFSVVTSIRQQADDALKVIRQKRPEDGERIARAILMRLVHFGEGGLSTRRQMEVGRLVDESSDPAAFREVFDVLRDEHQRIITVDSREVPDGERSQPLQVADLSHDAIISGWPVFHGWIQEHVGVEMERRAWLQRVDGELLTGNDLVAAEHWRARAATSHAVVEPSLDHYIERSSAEADRLAREREADAERKRRRLIIGLAAAVVVAIGLAALSLVALRARNDARSAQRTAEAETDRRVATQLQTSAAAYEGGLGLPALLVRAADLIDATDLGAIEMLATVERESGVTMRIDATERNVGFEAAALLPDGRVAIGDGFGGLDLWTFGAAKPDNDVDLDHGVLTMVVKPDTGLLVVGGGNVEADGRDFSGSDGWIDLIDPADQALTPRSFFLDSDSPVSTTLFDGDELIVGSWDGSVTVIDLSDPASPSIIRTLTVPDQPTGIDCTIEPADRKVRSLAIDDERRWLVAGANHCLAAVWDRTSLEPVATLTAHTSKVRAVAFVPGSSELLTTGDDSTIRSWDLTSPNPVATTLVEAAGDQVRPDSDRLEGRVVTMCVAPDGTGVVTAGRDHLVRRWTREDGQIFEPVEFASHVSTVRNVTCPTDTTFMSVAGDGFVVWDIERPNRWATPVVTEAGDPIDDIAVRPGDSGQVAVADGELRIVERDGTTRSPDQVEGTGPVVRVVYDDEGRFLAAIAKGVSGFPDRVVVYDADSLQLVTSFESSGNGELSSVTIVDEDNLVAGMNDGELLVVRAGERSDESIPTGRRASSVALTPDGRLLVGDVGGTLLCGRVDDMGDPASVELGRSVDDIDIARNGSVAIGTADGQIRAYLDVLGDDTDECDPSTWMGVSPPVEHDAINSVDQSATGDLLVAATSSDTVEIWDIPRLRLIGELTLGIGESTTAVSIDPDSSLIAVGGSTTALRFDVDRDGLRRRLCEIASRDLTPDEETAFLPTERYRELARCFD